MSSRRGRPVPAVDARGVRRSYPSPAGDVEVLKGIDIRIEQGEYVALTGASGSGKTTLLQCLAGLDRIDGGSVTVDGTVLSALPDARLSQWRARRIGVVFQQANLISVFTAVENVEIPLLLAGVRPRVARQRARDALERVQLSERAEHVPAALSGGEQQRVAIARAVVAEPAVVWADEPTGSLDRVTADVVADLLDAVHGTGTTLVVVTHDLSLAARAQRRIALLDGRLVPPSRQETDVATRR